MMLEGGVDWQGQAASRSVGKPAGHRPFSGTSDRELSSVTPSAERSQHGSFRAGYMAVIAARERGFVGEWMFRADARYGELAA